MFLKAWIYFFYLFFVWTVFRYFSQLPEVIEELWFKVLLWLAPLFWLTLGMRKRMKYFEGGFFRALFWGGGVGVIYGLIFWLVGMSFGRRIDLNMLGVSGVSAVTENLVFVGFLLPVFQDKYGKNRAMLLTAILFGLIHLPIAWFDYKLQGMMVFYLFLMTVILGYINSWLRLRTGNVGSAMLSSWIWSILVLS